jgi:hypothetical protein
MASLIYDVSLSSPWPLLAKATMIAIARVVAIAAISLFPYI